MRLIGFNYTMYLFLPCNKLLVVCFLCIEDYLTAIEINNNMVLITERIINGRFLNLLMLISINLTGIFLE